MRRFLPFAALLGVVFVLGCQDLGTGPAGPEGQPTVAVSTVAKLINRRGIIVSINRAEKHGAIQRTDDGLNTLYQFNVPSNLQGIIEVGDPVLFTIDPENSRHAILNLCPNGTVPPCPTP